MLPRAWRGRAMKCPGPGYRVSFNHPTGAPSQNEIAVTVSDINIE